VIAPAPIPFDRPTQERRAKKAEREAQRVGPRQSACAGRVRALEERYTLPVDSSWRRQGGPQDLLDVIADVDERILQVFTEAFVDVEREFQQVFSALFPGGEGRLVLTDPDDMLTTGIEVEARRPARRSSGCRCCPAGEKSLTAVAIT